MKSKVVKAIIACLIIGVVATGGYYGYNKFFASKPTQATAQYMSLTARKMNMEINIQGTGSAYAAVSKDVMPNNNGVIKNLNVKVGDTVKAGDTLFVSDSDDLRQNVSKAENNLERQKLQLSNAKNDNEVASDNLAISDAQNQLNEANTQLNNMTVTAPVGGIITAVNYSNGDNAQAGNAAVTIIDPNSMKIKVAVDELDIDKVKVGQKSQISFDAIKNKVYDGTVESIAQTGTSSNNVTTYDVVVSITNPTDIKIGMNANVNILVQSKENALAITSQALIEKNGKEYVMVPADNSSTSTTNNSQNNQGNAQGGQNQNSGNSGQGNNWQGGNGQGGNSQGGNGQRMRGGFGGYSGATKLVEIQIGLENENYVEVTSGITEGQKVLVAMPKVSSSGSSSGSKSGMSNGFGGMSGGFGGGFGGGGYGGGSGRSQGGNGGKGGN